MRRRSFLKPNLHIPRVTDLPLQFLKQQGLKTFFVDLDNTLTGWNSMEVTDEIYNWIENVKTYGFKLLLLSNNSSPRILPVAAALDIPFVAKAGKPRLKAFKRGAEITGDVMQQTVMIGDQLFTDIWGGKRAGAYTVLVRPLYRREFWGTRMARWLEKIVMNGWGDSGFDNKYIKDN